MKYIVIKQFRDGPGGQVYQPGERYPKRGRINERRAIELSTIRNRYSEPFIREIDEDDGI